MTSELSKKFDLDTTPRHWLARLDLELEQRGQRTSMIHASHEGPLRVQRPFYPESDGRCHIYILHPPGGMVIGDELRLTTALKPGAKGLLTTPSAGKIYGSGEQNLRQRQHIEFSLSEASELEWLPQETIVFNGAAGELSTRVHLQGNAKFFGWDILRLGRIAGNQPFVSGCCVQKIELHRDGRPLFMERNLLKAGSEFMGARWGAQSANTLATLIATLSVSRSQIDQLVENLNSLNSEEQSTWGVTQKKDILIVRYLGNCVVTCRKGFSLTWQSLRNEFCGKAAVTPRIWNT